MSITCIIAGGDKGQSSQAAPKGQGIVFNPFGRGHLAPVAVRLQVLDSKGKPKAKAGARTVFKVMPKAEEKGSSPGSPLGTHMVKLAPIARGRGMTLVCMLFHIIALLPALHRPAAEGGSIAKELRELKGLLKK